MDKMKFIIWVVTLVCVCHGKSITEVSTDVPDTCVNLTFACSDLHIARKCNAVTACIEVWESLTPPVDSNNELCDICKQMVKEARDQLLSNQTQEEMKEVFEGSCDLIPIKSIALECRKVVDELVPEIIEMLASRMDPNLVCTVAGLCNNGMLKSLIKKQYKMSKPLFIPINKEDKCVSCTRGMGFVRKALQIIPENDFTSLVLHSCMEEFHGTHSQCAELVFRLIPVYEHLLQKDPKTICSPLGRCDVFVPNPDSEECTLCHNFIGAAKLLRKSKGPLDQIKNFAINVCDQMNLDTSKRLECKDVVSTNFERVIHYLWSNEDPKKSCLRMCGQGVPNRKNDIMRAQYLGATACDACEEVVRYLVDQALDPNVKKQLELDIEKLCRKTGNFASICVSVVEQYFGEIYDEIIKGIDPTSTCKLLRLCSGQTPEASKFGKRMCEICHSYNSSDSIMKLTPMKDSSMIPLTKLCKTAEFNNINSEQCESFMKELSPMVYNFLRVVNPDVVCGQMTMCPAVKKITVTSGDELTCEFCEALFTYIKNIIDSKTTEDEFRNAFHNMCKDLKEFSTQCTELVDTYFDQFYDFLKKNLDPQNACSAIGLCSSASHTTRLIPATRIGILMPKVPILLSKAEQREHMLTQNKPYHPKEEVEDEREVLVKLLPSQPIDGINVPASYDTKQSYKDEYERESNNVNIARKFELPSLVANSEVECAVCKAIVIHLEQTLEDNRTEESVRQALDKVCSYFPNELAAQCRDFVNEYTELFISLLVSHTDPNTICAAIKACPSGNSALPKDLPTALESKAAVSTPQCLLCVKIVTYLEQELGNNRTEEAIKKALEKVCNELPQKWAEQCDQFVEEYADIIIELLTHEVAPTMICAALGLCPAQNGGSQLECTVCQYILHYLQEQLMDNSTQEEVKHEVELVCSRLPKTLKDNCDAFIEEFGSSLMVLLAQRLDPSVLCTNLKICPGLTTKPTPPTLKVDTCTTCEMVVNYMDKLLENDDVDTQITTLVEKICVIFPMSARDECTQIIGLYGPYLLQMIGQLADSNAVCKAVDLCSKSNGKALLGGKKCTYGPSYWCQTRSHATACNAHTYCKQKMWKR